MKKTPPHSLPSKPPSYLFSRNLFLRLLGGIYLIAFLSFWPQAEGLIGSNGILPLGPFLKFVGERTGPERIWLLPTLSWIDSRDIFLHFLCGGGVFLSILLIAGVAPFPVTLLLWAFYLSLVTDGQDFMEFQWDNLLLEAGFLAVLISPWKWRVKLRDTSAPPPLGVWLFRWLLFRLIFSSGVVKLATGDPTWWNLTALNFHYETQPLPTWVGWYLHQLPEWFQRFSVFGMFVVELGLPFLIFGPRRLKRVAAAGIVLLQILIAATGNYCFFNLLTVALCLFLFDDAFWVGLARQKTPLLPLPVLWGVVEVGGYRCPPKWVVLPLAGVILIVSTFELSHAFRRRIDWPAPVIILYRAIAPFRTVNGYGLFAVMTTTRTEIIVEGSNDGVNWLAYEFKWKPGDLKRRPGFVAPHQPRLDWQMWFAALSTYRQQPWFVNFMTRLLKGSPSVLRLLGKDPFGGRPPVYVRAVAYAYGFSHPSKLGKEGKWWRSTRTGAYFPQISLAAGS